MIPLLVWTIAEPGLDGKTVRCPLGWPFWQTRKKAEFHIGTTIGLHSGNCAWGFHDSTDWVSYATVIDAASLFNGYTNQNMVVKLNRVFHD